MCYNDVSGRPDAGRAATRLLINPPHSFAPLSTRVKHLLTWHFVHFVTRITKSITNIETSKTDCLVPFKRFRTLAALN